MARTATANVTFKATGRLSNTVSADLSASMSGSLGDTIDMVFTTGTSALQINRIWSDKGRTITSGNDEDIDLFDFAGTDIGPGAALDSLGLAVSFADVSILLVQNQSVSAGTLILGGETSAAAWNSPWAGSDTATNSLLPGQVLMIGGSVDPGYAVADSSNHLLTVGASGGNITYDIHIFGRSA